MTEQLFEVERGLDPLERYLDRMGIGSGPALLESIGDGHSNLTFLVTRGDAKVVLRRPPRGPLAPSANHVVREAKILDALAATAVPVPEVLAIEPGVDVLGAPFFLAGYVAGEVLMDRLPVGFDPALDPPRIADQLIAALAEVHAVDLEATGLARFARSGGYLERQLGRFDRLLADYATRPLPDLERVHDWLGANPPESRPPTLVHGDFRLGNLMFGRGARLVAVLDWEMATIGDPLADLGYCTAFWAESGDPPNPMLELSGVTRLPGFPGRDELARHYAEATGRSLADLRWYQVLALWKAAIFLECSYGRFTAGESADGYFERLGEGVPVLARQALERTVEPRIQEVG